MFRPTANVKPQIESWDEDEDILANDNDLSGLRNFSTTTSTTLFSSRTGFSNRDSMQSQRSEHVDIVMHDGFNEDNNDDWQVTVPGNDAEKAIMSAKSAGIPLPNNVPASALIGGTIKRLGAKKSWRKMVDDWSEDLEMPIGASTAAQAGLTLKPLTTEFPDAIPQDVLPSIESEKQIPAGQPAGKFGTITNLSQLRGANKTNKPTAQTTEDDDAFGDDFEDVPTLRISKRALRPALNFGTGLDGTTTSTTQINDNMDEDFEFSGNMNSPLRLSTTREAPKTPITSGFDDMDSDWAEGSLGSAFGSKDSLAQNQPPRRSGRTDRSSSISAMSPSVFSPSLSSVTAESDEDKLDGLVLPEGPLSFSKTLRPGAELASVPEENASVSGPVSAPLETPTPRPLQKGNDDFFADIDIGEGEILNKSKPTLNRNIKHKVVERTSPTRRPVTTLTFTNKPLQSQGSNESIGVSGTRIPKPIESAIPRPRLEPVLERANPFSSPIQNRHSNNSSVSSIPAPTTPSQYTPSIPGTPSRRPLNNRPSQTLTRPEPTTNTAQYLRSKRSMPQLRSAQPSINAARSIPVPPVPRPPSRSDRSTRSFAQSRPKTPIDRAAETTAVANRRPPMTFLPAGAASGQSHHIATKQPSRTTFRPKSSESSDPSHSSSTSHAQSSRPMSRLSSTGFRPRTPTSRRNDMAEMLAKQALNKRTLTKPTRRRAYGDGNELDAFDDLPTSASAESRYMKQPKMMGNVGGGAIRKINSNQSIGSSGAANTGKGLSGKLSSGTLASKEGQATIPGFARDTASSRIARQERLNTYQPHLARTGHGSNDSTLTVTHWKPSTSTSTSTVPATPRTLRRTAHKLPAKPHLIKPLGSAGDKARSEKGMSYNPTLQRWEGNWGALTPFDVPMTPTQPASPTPAKPALIANVGTQKGVQVVGKMVFDPIGMRWLKMRGPLPGGAGDRASSSGAMSITTDGDEDDDPFAGMDDLVDERKVAPGIEGEEKMEGSDEDRAVGEEFDVGPAFVKRQRQEEERWERKLAGWKALVREEGVRERGDIRRFVAAVSEREREEREEVW